MTAAGIVLTGGRSTRMGTDKASLVVDGRRLVDHVVEALRRSGVRRIMVAGPLLSGLASDVECCPDASDAPLGPMAGIAAAWSALRTTANYAPDPVVVVACDLPALTPAVIDALIARAPSARHGAVASDGLSLQPLLAAYRPLALDDLSHAFAAGERSVLRCLGGWDLAVVEFEPAEVADADTPAYLAGFGVEWADDTGENSPR